MLNFVLLNLSVFDNNNNHYLIYTCTFENTLNWQLKCFFLLVQTIPIHRGKSYFYEPYRFRLNKKTNTPWYCECFKRCSVCVMFNPTLTSFKRRPGDYNHDDEIENILGCDVGNWPLLIIY